eukprot:646502-Rhodomonas_salina.1
MAVTGCDRKQCHKMIENAFKSVDHSKKAHQFLWDKHKFAGPGQRPTYVLTINEAIGFIDCIPTRHTEDVKQYIRKQFVDTTETQQTFLTELGNKRPRETKELEQPGFVYA